MKEEKRNVCRICLRYDLPKCLSLFERFNDCLISDKIYSIVDIEIQQDDGLPDRICPECLLQLENAIAFKSKCIASHLLLKNRIHQSKTGDYITEVPIKEEQRTDDDTRSFGDIEDAEIKLEQDVQPTEIFDSIQARAKPTQVQARPNKPIDSVQCDDCGGDFKSKCKLRVHWKKVHLQDRLTCTICKRIFKSYKAFNVHKKSKSRSCDTASKVRIEGMGKSRMYHCLHCPYKTASVKCIEAHLVTHTGYRRFQCDKCPRDFTQQGSLQAHQEAAHQKYLLETTCQYCGKIIKGRSKFYRHLNSHHTEAVQCDICKKILKSKKNLIAHMQRHSGVKSYTCEICSTSFYTSSDLANHKAKIHIKRTFKCDICGYTLSSQGRVNIHRAKHSVTNVVCLICGTFVEDAKRLVLHQRRHFVRNYPCMYCEKTFYTSKSRSRHVSSKHKAVVLKVNKPICKVKTANVKKEVSNDIVHDEDAITLSPC